MNTIKSKSGASHDNELRKALWMGGLVFDTWEDERDRVYALVTCLVKALEPIDPHNPASYDRLIEWRIAEVIEELLASNKGFKRCRDMLLEANK